MTLTVGGLLEKHGLTQQRAAHESGIPLATLNDVVAGRREPRKDTINKLIVFLRRYEPRLTPGQLYERLFFMEHAA